MTLSFAIGYHLLSIEDGLDAINKKIDIPGAVGNARLRTVGMVINIGITVNNIQHLAYQVRSTVAGELDSERLTVYQQRGSISAKWAHEKFNLYGVRFRMAARLGSDVARCECSIGRCD